MPTSIVHKKCFHDGTFMVKCHNSTEYVEKLYIAGIFMIKSVCYAQSFSLWVKTFYILRPVIWCQQFFQLPSPVGLRRPCGPIFLGKY